METFESRLQEFKDLKNKCQPSNGYMQGLTPVEYSRINSLHSFLMSSEKGRQEHKKLKL